MSRVMTDHPAEQRAVRTDIQALRAVAVGVVVIYHLFPSRLTGGFIGVDAFFVISGFLITLHLVERPPRSGGDLLAFWARRVRRLLPASLTVLVATLAGAGAFLPESQWETTAEHGRAAALYVANWQLAADAVDYLAAENAPSAIQHFWSLGVEEQFYLGWPVLLLALTVLVPLAHRARGYWLGLGAVVVASFAWSVHLTGADPAAAYFVTFTRLWELGAGGLLALCAPAARRWSQHRPTSANVMSIAGWGLIVGTALLYTESTPFPGWQAALPVAGAALVMAAHRQLWIYRLPGVQWLGDVSYAVYLWHWPLIVIAPVALSEVTGSPERGRLDSLVIIVLTLVLAGLTKVYVEDRFRTPAFSRRVRSSLAAGAVGMAVVVVMAMALAAAANQQQRDDRVAVEEALAGKDPCFGARALDAGAACPPAEGPLIPSPALAVEDRSPADKERPVGGDCFSDEPSFPDLSCEFGQPEGDVEVALVGNSHAGHWLPALEQIAKTRSWRITTHLASKCTAADLAQEFEVEGADVGCVEWIRRTSTAVASARPDLIIFVNRTGRPALGESSIDASVSKYTAGFRKTLVRLSSTGVPVVVIRDTPIPVDGGIDSIPDCLALNADDLAACSGPRSVWLPADPSIAAARELRDRGVSVADLTDAFCDESTCWGAVGGVIVYADGHHITGTYARTIAPRLEKILVDRLDNG